MSDYVVCVCVWVWMSERESEWIDDSNIIIHNHVHDSVHCI